MHVLTPHGYPCNVLDMTTTANLITELIETITAKGGDYRDFHLAEVAARIEADRLDGERSRAEGEDYAEPTDEDILEWIDEAAHRPHRTPALSKGYGG